MNKKLLKFFAAAAMSVLALACAKEQVGPGEGAMVEATFSVDVPGVEVSTKGLSDAASVNELVFDAFRSLNDTEPIEGLRQVVAVENGRATIQVKLIKGQNYRFVFWAQKANNGYYNTDNLSNITVDYKNALANDSSLDAFFAKEEVTNVQNPISKTIILKRPFAQVNYVTKEELSEGLYIKESQITVKNALTSFNPLRNKLSGAKDAQQDVTFQFNAVPTEKLLINGTEYNYLATAFILAKSDNSKDIVDVEAKFKTNNGRSVTVSTPGLPCQRNYRTNVIGNFMSVDGTYNVEIDSAFKGDLQSDYVENALNSGQVVTLTEDYSLPEGSGGVAVLSGKTSVLNLNGKKFSNENGLKENKAALQVHGDLTINGDGEVYCKGGADNNAIIVEQGGHLVINGGTYNVGANTNSGKSNATIFVMGPDKYGRNGSVEINGGVFMAEAGSDGTPFVLNQHDDITGNCFSVKGGTFVGFNPADNNSNGAHTNYVATGYKSVKISESPETWEVVDASVSVAGQSELETTLNTVAKGESVYMKLADGEYALYGKTVAADKDLSIAFIGNGADKTSFKVGKETVGNDYGTDYSLKGASATFKKMKIVSTNGAYKGFAHAKELYFEDCTLVGQFAYMGLKASFKNCQFIQESVNAYNLQTYTADEYVFDNCTFKASGKFLYTFREKTTSSYKVAFNNCHFIALAGETTKSAVSLKTDSYPSDGGAKYYVYFNKTDATDNVLVGELTGSRLYSSDLGYNAETKTETRETQAVVYVDNKKVWENGAKVE